jgi:hypothetical protein
MAKKLSIPSSSTIDDCNNVYLPYVKKEILYKERFYSV